MCISFIATIYSGYDDTCNCDVHVKTNKFLFDYLVNSLVTKSCLVVGSDFPCVSCVVIVICFFLVFSVGLTTSSI